MYINTRILDQVYVKLFVVIQCIGSLNYKKNIIIKQLRSESKISKHLLILKKII